MLKVKAPETTGFLYRSYLPAIAKGLAVTMSHFTDHIFKHGSKTVEYPEERYEYSGRFRGLHILTRHENGEPRCVACYMCQTVCPADCIRIEAEETDDPKIEKRPKSFQIDMLRCVFCGFCVEACPKEAIIMSSDYEASETSREATLYKMDKLMGREKIGKWKLGFRPYEKCEDGSGQPVKIGPGTRSNFRPAFNEICDNKNPAKK